MQEKLFQFLWKYQYFNKSELCTTSGIPITIIKPGVQNTNQGPDFGQARIKIGDTTWAGNVELHIKSSDWLLHQHHRDAHYHKVILHVVWEHDKEILDEYAQPIHTIELKNRIANAMVDMYNQWQLNKQTIPCGEQAIWVNDLIKKSWIDRLSVERLSNKVTSISQLLQKTNNHWEEVFWILLCRYFGGNKNAECFQQVAESLPLKLLAKHKLQIHQLECLLMGQANLLHGEANDKYTKLLQNEYHFLASKYQLIPVTKLPTFLRMRPVSFPTIRLAQLAALILQSTNLFSKIIAATDVSTVIDYFKVSPNLYWETHYSLGKETDAIDKSLGESHVQILMINVVVPILFA